MSRDRALVVSLVLAGVAAAPGADQSPQFRAGTHTVPVFATVQDASGRLVSDLDRDDFEVYDNGVRQPVTAFARGEQPITAVMMLDRSGSVQPHYALVQNAATAFVQRLGPGDKARIGSFSERVQIDPENFTADRAELLDVIMHRLQSIGPTPLWNAVAVAMTALSRESGRRVVLVFTDGRDAPLTGPANVTFQEVRQRAEVEEVMVYGIGLINECAPITSREAASLAFDLQRPPQGQGRGRARPPGGRIRLPVPLPRPLPGRGGPPRVPAAPAPWRTAEDPCEDEEPDPNLRRLAQVGGGGYFELRHTDNLSATFARVADELRQQYLLAFVAPAHDGALHTLEVRVRRPGVSVRARKSYLAPGNRSID